MLTEAREYKKEDFGTGPDAELHWELAQLDWKTGSDVKVDKLSAEDAAELRVMMGDHPDVHVAVVTGETAKTFLDATERREDIVLTRVLHMFLGRNYPVPHRKLARDDMFVVPLKDKKALLIAKDKAQQLLTTPFLFTSKEISFFVNRAQITSMQGDAVQLHYVFPDGEELGDKYVMRTWQRLKDFFENNRIEGVEFKEGNSGITIVLNRYRFAQMGRFLPEGETFNQLVKAIEKYLMKSSYTRNDPRIKGSSPEIDRYNGIIEPLYQALYQDSSKKEVFAQQFNCGICDRTGAFVTAYSHSFEPSLRFQHNPDFRQIRKIVSDAQEQIKPLIRDRAAHDSSFFSFYCDLDFYLTNAMSSLLTKAYCLAEENVKEMQDALSNASHTARVPSKSGKQNCR